MSSTVVSFAPEITRAAAKSMRVLRRYLGRPGVAMEPLVIESVYPSIDRAAANPPREAQDKRDSSNASHQAK